MARFSLPGSEGAVVVTNQSGGVDPRFPQAYQRGGAASAPILDEGLAVAGAGRSAATAPDAQRAARGAQHSARPDQRPNKQLDEQTGQQSHPQPDQQPNPPADERHFELVVAGNPWLRVLGVVGFIAIVAGFALTVYAEFAFSVPPASGIYDPRVYIVPRIAEAVAQPLVIAGVIALVAAMTLRIVAWRPSRVTAVIAER